MQWTTDFRKSRWKINCLRNCSCIRLCIDSTNTKFSVDVHIHAHTYDHYREATTFRLHATRINFCIILLYNEADSASIDALHCRIKQNWCSHQASGAAPLELLMMFVFAVVNFFSSKTMKQSTHINTSNGRVAIWRDCLFDFTYLQSCSYIRKNL